MLKLCVRYLKQKQPNDKSYWLGVSFELLLRLNFKNKLSRRVLLTQGQIEKNLKTSTVGTDYA